LIILRYKEGDKKRGFKVPLNIGKFPVIPFLGLLTLVFLAANLEYLVILMGFILLLVAFPVYILQKKIRNKL
jgi:APA family basic amino acid/polyamine antiporter